MPESGHCLGKARNASSKWADSSLRRAKTGARNRCRAVRASRRRRRLLTWGTDAAGGVAAALLLAGAVAQWVRPLPHATLKTGEVRLPGMAPSFAWPSSGEAAATVVGVGTVGEVRGSQSVRVAGLAELLRGPTWSCQITSWRRGTTAR